MNKPTTQPAPTTTKTGYCPIYRTGDYGGRTIEDAILYEREEDALSASKNEDDFVAFATVTWEE